MLTDSKVRNARPKPGVKVTKLSDEKGLYLEVKERRGKIVRLWRYRFYLGGKETVVPIGEYPDKSLVEAREEHKKLRRWVKQGLHPSKQLKKEERELREAERQTFRAVSGRYMAKYRNEVTARTHDKHANLLFREVYPVIGDTPVIDVEPRHIKKILDNLSDRPTMAITARQNMGKTFDLAIIEGHAVQNPTIALKSHIKLPETQHQRALKPKEVHTFFSGLYKKEPVVTQIAFELMFLTLARTVEQTGAKWAEFELESKLWIIPPERMKKRQEHRVPLPDRAVELLGKLQVINGHREHLFPGRDNPRQPVSKGWLNRIVKRLGFSDFSPHGIRATGSTLLNEMGYRPDVIEAQLAHQERNLTRRSYNRADYLDERRQMMQAWADYLDSLKQSASVMPIGSKNIAR